MAESPEGTLGRWRGRLVSHLAQSQHRNAYYLLLNTVIGAAAGLLFWFLLARLANLPPADVGVGYAVVALGTTVGILAKGGLDTALLRNVPDASRKESARLLRFAALLGACIASALAIALQLASTASGAFPDITPYGWALVATIGVLLVVTWLQDAYFLAEGDARFSFQRNVVFSGVRLLLPLPVVALGLSQPIALTWMIALAVSALAAASFAHGLPRRPGRLVPRHEFLRSAVRNVTGSASEFLPGLLLAPIVLAINGPEAAGFFGIAWAAASLLFLASAAISRSSLAEMVRGGSASQAVALRRAILQHFWLVAPVAVGGIVLAPQVLSIFGPAYAQEGALVFAILCASVVVVAPAYLYLAVLRARERPLGLVAFPAGIIAVLFVLAPLLTTHYGLAGIAMAWMLSNAPFGAYAAWKLRRKSREVRLRDPARIVGGTPHVE